MIVEEEVAKKVEEMVAKRVEEELAKRKDEIELEVLRRVEEAKSVMEKQILEEFEKKRSEEQEFQQKKEVMCLLHYCVENTAAVFILKITCSA